jgi:hypothetical protein
MNTRLWKSGREQHRPLFHSCYDYVVPSSAWKDRNTRPNTCHSSSRSIRQALTSHRHESGLGKSVATAVRRWISRLSRSTRLVVRSLRWWAGGKSKTVRPSGMFCSSHSARREALFAYFCTSLARYISAVGRSGALKILRLCRGVEQQAQGLEASLLRYFQSRPSVSTHFPGSRRLLFIRLATTICGLITATPHGFNKNA